MKNKEIYIANSPQKDFKQLMSSIEGKLELLASQNFQIQDNSLMFANSMPVPAKQYQSPYKIHHNSSKLGLKLSDLYPNDPSPVMTKLDKIQQHYISQLNILNHKLTFLQSQNATLLEQNHRLNEQLLKNNSKYEILQRQQSNILQSRIEQLQEKLMSKIRQEIEDDISKYLCQLQMMRKQLLQQKKIVKKLYNDNDNLKNERNNLEGLYKDLLQKYKNIVQSQIDTSQIHHHEDYQLQNQQNNHNRFIQDHHQYHSIYRDDKSKKKQSKTTNYDKISDKRSKKSKSNKINAASLSREEIIPFLTKGIQQLKEKLKMQ